MTTKFEVEQKYRVDDLAKLEQRLRVMGGVEGPPRIQGDTYFNHPSRDFADTQEAFRIRRDDDAALITYKGSKLPGVVKARRELEWRLDPGDPGGTQMQELLGLLGFRQIAVVRKQRRPFVVPDDLSDFAVVIDHVAGLGQFAEIELIVADSSQIETARTRITQLGEQLELRQPEPCSYLKLLLESNCVKMEGR